MDECLLFCEVALRAVLVDYEENTDVENRDCLLEMLELALRYILVMEEELDDEGSRFVLPLAYTDC